MGIFAEHKKKPSNNLCIIADYFIALANSTGSLVTNLKLQKLVFYTQAWHLAVFGNEVFPDDFQAWIHGPVVPALYDQYKHLKWRPIDRDDLSEESLSQIYEKLPANVREILDDVVEIYFSLDAYELERRTHTEEPWIKARGGISSDTPCTNVIDKAEVMKYYSQFVIRNGEEL